MTRHDIDCRIAGILAITLVFTGCTGNDPAAQLYDDTIYCILAMGEAVRRFEEAEGDLSQSTELDDQRRVQVRLTHEGFMWGQAFAFGRLTGRSPDQVEDDVRERGDTRSERLGNLFESADIDDLGDRWENYPPCKAIPFPGSTPF